ncbi:hypothetical protein AOLI_G00087030 [Acnodon oligacanthus]
MIDAVTCERRETSRTGPELAPHSDPAAPPVTLDVAAKERWLSSSQFAEPTLSSNCETVVTASGKELYTFYGFHFTELEERTNRSQSAKYSAS